MELTSTEKAIIEAYRNGASIDVVYYSVTDADEAIEKVNEFGNVKEIVDLTNENGDIPGSFISFRRRVRKLWVSCFVDTGRS